MTSPTQFVAANIRAEVARRRIPQRVLAEALGLTQQSVSMRLAGKTPIDLNELGIIANVLGVEPAHLITQAVAS